MRVILKFSFFSRRYAPSRITAMPYLKKRMASVEAPLFIRGFAKRGFSPYVMPVMMPAG